MKATPKITLRIEDAEELIKSACEAVAAEFDGAFKTEVEVEVEEAPVALVITGTIFAESEMSDNLGPEPDRLEVREISFVEKRITAYYNDEECDYFELFIPSTLVPGGQVSVALSDAINGALCRDFVK